jgi:hypothetical protein
LRHTPRERQAKAGAAIAARCRRIRLHEGVEQARELFLVHANAGVNDVKTQPGVFIVAHERDHNANRTIRSELYRIAHEVDQNLLQPRGVTGDGLWYRAGNVQFQYEFLGLSAHLHQFAHVPQYFQRGTADLLDLHSVGLDFGQVEDVVD